MAKKSLGRGLDEISDIFITARKDKELRNGFSLKKLRDTTCECCAHIINDSNNVSKCKIFTLNNEAYGVRYIHTISLTSGCYCEFFEPVFKEKADNSSVTGEASPGNAEINCDIEESVTVRRHITYPNTMKAQEDMLKSLYKHIEEDYSVKRIELRKTERISQPGMNKCTEEIVTIFIGGGTGNGNHD